MAACESGGNRRSCVFTVQRVSPGVDIDSVLGRDLKELHNIYDSSSKYVNLGNVN